MTGKTTSGQIVEMRLALSEWVKLFVSIAALVAGASGFYYRLDSRVNTNTAQVRTNKEANERTAAALAEVTRLVDRMSGREEARDERGP